MEKTNYMEIEIVERIFSMDFKHQFGGSKLKMVLGEVNGKEIYLLNGE